MPSPRREEQGGRREGAKKWKKEKEGEKMMEMGEWKGNEAFTYFILGRGERRKERGGLEGMEEKGMKGRRKKKYVVKEGR